MKNYDHVNDLINGGNTRRSSVLWKPQDGGYSHIRILPSNPISAKAFRHWNVMDKKVVQCLGSSCPICAVAKALQDAAARYAKGSEVQKTLEKAGRNIRCEYRIAYNVLVPQADGTHAVRVWATTGGNQTKLKTLIEQERQEDPKFDPTAYDLSVGFDSKAAAANMYTLKFMVRGGPSEIALPDWESQVHDLSAALDSNAVDLDQDQAVTLMEEQYGGVLTKLGFGSVAALVTRAGAGGPVDTGALESLVDRAGSPGASRAEDPPEVSPTAPRGDQGADRAAAMLSKLDD
jgi:hypothetical protein